MLFGFFRRFAISLVITGLCAVQATLAATVRAEAEKLPRGSESLAKGLSVRRLVLKDPQSGIVIRQFGKTGVTKNISKYVLPTHGIIIDAETRPNSDAEVNLNIAKVSQADEQPVRQLGYRKVSNQMIGAFWQPDPGTYLLTARAGRSLFKAVLNVTAGRKKRIAIHAGAGAPAAVPAPVPSKPAALPLPAWQVLDGKIVLNGEPVFPRGFYYVSHYADQKAQRLADLQKIAAAGFNLLQTPIDRNDQQLLDAAAAGGVSIVMEFNDSVEHLLQLFGNHPALAMLCTHDDVDARNGSVQRYEPQDVAERSRALQALASRALTYASGGYPARITNYIGVTDVVGQQAYPVPSEPVSSVFNGYLNPILDDFREAEVPIIANLQTFGWYGTYRLPTPAEVRSMTYQALLAGVKGILYYAYRDIYTDLNDKPALWNELTGIAGELAVLEPYLVRGERQTINTAKQEVFAAKWRLGSEAVIAVVNAGTADKAVSLEIAEDLDGSAVNLFVSRAGLMTLTGDVLTGTLPAQSVQVYLAGLSS